MAGLDYVNMPGKAQAVLEEIDRRILETEIKPLVTKELIEEHKKTPIGFQSEELLRVLYFLRRNHLVTAGKYVIVCTKPHEEWCIGEVGTMRGIPIKIHDECFSSRLEAEHGLFLRRLRDLELLPA